MINQYMVSSKKNDLQKLEHDLCTMFFLKSQPWNYVDLFSTSGDNAGPGEWQKALEEVETRMASLTCF